VELDGQMYGISCTATCCNIHRKTKDIGVNKWLKETMKSRVTGLDIMEEYLGLERSQQSVVTGRRVSQIMGQAGWPKTGRRINRKDKSGELRKVYEWSNPRNDYFKK
jgi:hypothetical protein